MKIALHAEPVLMSVLLKLYPKATSTRSIPIFAPIVVHVQMFARLRRSILNSYAIQMITKGRCNQRSFLLTGVISCLSQNALNIRIIHKIPKVDIFILQHI